MFKLIGLLLSSKIFRILLIIYIFKSVLGNYLLLVLYHIKASQVWISGFIPTWAFVFVITFFIFIFIYKYKF